MKTRRPPERRCVGCRRGAPQREMVRVHRDPLGEARVDLGRGGGRGAYVHRSQSCVRLARSTRGMARALRPPLSEAEAVTLVEELRRVVGDGL